MIPSFAIGVDHQSDPGRPAGVVFDALNPARYPRLVPFEIHLSQQLFGATTLVMHGDFPAKVPPALASLAADQRLMRLPPGKL
jgi:hypothetical protein